MYAISRKATEDEDLRKLQIDTALRIGAFRAVAPMKKAAYRAQVPSFDPEPIPEGFLPGEEAPRDGSSFMANIRFANGHMSRDEIVSWRTASESMREYWGHDLDGFDTIRPLCGLSFWQGECWIHSWHPLHDNKRKALPDSGKQRLTHPKSYIYSELSSKIIFRTYLIIALCVIASIGVFASVTLMLR